MSSVWGPPPRCIIKRAYADWRQDVEQKPRQMNARSDRESERGRENLIEAWLLALGRLQFINMSLSIKTLPYSDSLLPWQPHFFLLFAFFPPPRVEGEVNDTNPPDAQVDFQTPLSNIISVSLFYGSVFALWAAVGREEIFYARYSLCVRSFRKVNDLHLNSLWNTAEDLH